LRSDDNPDTWRCPKCDEEDSDSEADAPADPDDVHMANKPADEQGESSQRLATVSSQKAATKPDTHSVFNDEDHTDGSRVLRKRKTSSIEGVEERATSKAMTIRKVVGKAHLGLSLGRCGSKCQDSRRQSSRGRETVF
jgi:hypothetical protein